MSSEEREVTREGVFGKVAGKAKEIAGDLTDNEALAREGRLQQEQVDASADAAEARADAEAAEELAEVEEEATELEREQKELEAEVEARRAAERAEQERRGQEAEAESEAAEQIDAVETQRQTQEKVAATEKAQAETARTEGQLSAIELEQQAAAAEARANKLDPKENA